MKKEVSKEPNREWGINEQAVVGMSSLTLLTKTL